MCGRDNNNIGAGFIGGGRCGIKWGLGRRGGISGSEWVEWCVMKRGGQVITQDRQWAGNTAGRDDVVEKPKLKEGQNLVLL